MGIGQGGKYLGLEVALQPQGTNSQTETLNT
jgi:hypothetical protein